MAQVNERVEERDGFGDVPPGEVREQSSGRTVLECDCRARLVLVDREPARRPLACGVCGKRFALTRTTSHRDHREARSFREERRYSWLTDYLERLEGREARHELYARLERLSYGDECFATNDHATDEDRRLQLTSGVR